MVNYGYDKYTKNWKERNKYDLAMRLSGLITTMQEEGKIQLKGFQDAPHVEIDRLYKGVRIRKITHLSEEIQDELIKRSDEIYKNTMGWNGSNL